MLDLCMELHERVHERMAFLHIRCRVSSLPQTLEVAVVVVAPACALLSGLLETKLALPSAVRSFEKYVLQPLTMGDVAAVALCCLYLSIQD